MRLIDVNALREEYELAERCNDCPRYGKKDCDYPNYSARDFCGWLDDAPTIEAEPVRHGHWIDIWDENDPDTSMYGRCTKCNRISERPLGQYCRWCGAKMDE